MPAVKKMPFQIVIAIDILLNTLCGGWAGETFSARCWRRRDLGWGWAWARRVIDALFFWESNHCEESYFACLRGHYLPPDMYRE